MNALGRFSVYTMASGSMRPVLCEGDHVLAAAASVYRPGDILVFEPPEPGGVKYVHRLIKVVSREGRTYFISKGDAGSVPDAPVTEERVVGRVAAVWNSEGRWVDFDCRSVRSASRLAAWVYRALPGGRRRWPRALSESKSAGLRVLARALRAAARATARRGWRGLKRPRSWALSGALWFEDCAEGPSRLWDLAHKTCAWTLRRWIDRIGR